MGCARSGRARPQVGTLLPQAGMGTALRHFHQYLGFCCCTLFSYRLPATLNGLACLSACPAEAYEEHFVLPDDRVVLLTSCSILLVHAPGFAQLDGAAEIGGGGGWVGCGRNAPISPIGSKDSVRLAGPLLVA